MWHTKFPQNVGALVVADVDDGRSEILVPIGGALWPPRRQEVV